MKPTQEGKVSLDFQFFSLSQIHDPKEFITCFAKQDKAAPATEKNMRDEIRPPVLQCLSRFS